MTITIIDINGTGIAELISENIEIANAQDALELLANAGYQGAENIIIHQKNITPDFFDLKTGIAGEVLQKFSTYQVKLAIVGDFSAYTSKSLKDFIYESNKAGRINFVHSIPEAKESLLKK
ncbi:DUF4180 domain-containing protein [Runella sp.]|uniref:DUF4180 domain-containing protein n=1 Tax=Runella sp. TaxID=1960881 RepID=UPI003D0C4FA7